MAYTLSVEYSDTVADLGLLVLVEAVDSRALVVIVVMGSYEKKTGKMENSVKQGQLSIAISWQI